MAPIGYADGLLKPANQVRAQKNLVKSVPGSNLPKQPAKSTRVKQSVTDMLAEQRVKRQQQAYLPPGGSVGPIREIEKMKGLSGINREVDFDKTFKTREQIGKITSQADMLRRGQTVAEAMREAEELGHHVRHNPQWMNQDRRQDQIDKRRQALIELVRTNRNPQRNVEEHVPPRPQAPPGGRFMRGVQRRVAERMAATPARRRLRPQRTGTPPRRPRRRQPAESSSSQQARDGRLVRF